MSMFGIAVQYVDVLIRDDEGLTNKFTGTVPPVMFLPFVMLVERVALVQKELLAVYHSYKLGWKNYTK